MQSPQQLPALKKKKRLYKIYSLKYWKKHDLAWSALYFPLIRLCLSSSS